MTTTASHQPLPPPEAAGAEEETVYDHRILKLQHETDIAADDQALASVLKPMQGNIVQVHQLPTYDVKPPPRFLQVSGHYPPQSLLPEGLVTHLKGDAPLTAESAHVVVTHKTGMGVTLFPIKNSQKLNDQEIETRVAQAVKNGVIPPLGPHSGQYIGVHSSKAARDHYMNYGIVVKANDSAGATKLLENLQSANTPTTLHELATGPALESVMESSQNVRRQLAHQTAAALGVEIDDHPSVTAISHQIVRASGKGHAPVYKVMSDAYDTESSHDGVLLSNGIQGGLTHLRSQQSHQRTHNTPSHAWSNEATSSALGTHNGNFDSRIHKQAEVHPLESDETLSVFHNKVHHGGVPHVPHELVSEKIASRDDPVVKSWQFGSVGGGKSSSSSTPALEKTDWHFVAGAVPDTTTLDYLTADELIELAKKIKHTPGSKSKSVVVPLDSRVVTQIVNRWDKISKHLPPDYTLERFAASVSKQPVDQMLALSTLDTERVSAAAASSDQQQEAASTEKTTTTTGPHMGGGGYDGPMMGYERMMPSDLRYTEYGYEYPVGWPMYSTVPIDFELVRAMEEERANEGEWREPLF